ncbi:LacI family DNA-binding transcriptional regulator [Rhodothermus marinus]|uniref:LacI family DNA-binding transcriptional regulator n=1 Tax=Rhodothermus marinus TaxID=29549 RepID=UPI000ACD9802|nr:LacI family DNA-binding transcriptional regulator [Rhodothermus marinus]
MEKLTIDQVASLACVSRSVVSRVLNNHPNVSEEARRRVLEVIKKYNYRPSSVARSLATRRTYEICILTPRRGNEALANGFWTLLHLGIFEQCIQRGYYVSLSMLSGDAEEELEDRLLNEHSFDGFVLLTSEVAERVIDTLRERGTPAVLVGHDPAYPDVSSVDVDNFGGAYRAVRHLCRLGHRRVAAILGHPELQETRDRRAGYLQALQDAGAEVQETLIEIGDYSQRSGYEIMQRWLERGPDFSAVFCASDTMAIGALLALYEAGVRVPDQMAVVGFDDLPCRSTPVRR